MFSAVEAAPTRLLGGVAPVLVLDVFAEAGRSSGALPSGSSILTVWFLGGSFVLVLSVSASFVGVGGGLVLLRVARGTSICASYFFGGLIVALSLGFTGFSGGGGGGGGVVVFGMIFGLWGGLFKVLRLSVGVDAALPRDSFSLIAKKS